MVRRETPETFLATAPVGPDFCAFALQEHATLYELADDADNLVILSNGTDAAAAFRRGRGKVRVWQTFFQRLPSCPASEAADTLREMTAWMFEHHSADSVCAFGAPKNEKLRSFTKAAGGRLICEADDRDLFEFARCVH